MYIPLYSLLNLRQVYQKYIIRTFIANPSTAKYIHFFLTCTFLSWSESCPFGKQLHTPARPPPPPPETSSRAPAGRRWRENRPFRAAWARRRCRGAELGTDPTGAASCGRSRCRRGRGRECPPGWGLAILQPLRQQLTHGAQKSNETAEAFCVYEGGTEPCLEISASSAPPCTPGCGAGSSAGSSSGHLQGTKRK